MTSCDNTSCIVLLPSLLNGPNVADDHLLIIGNNFVIMPVLIINQRPESTSGLTSLEVVYRVNS